MDENQENKPQQTFSERMKESQLSEPSSSTEGSSATPPTKQKNGSIITNKYVIVVFAIILIIVAGALYRTFFVAEIDKPIVTGVEKTLSIVTHENTWNFDPEFIEADQGDRIILTITNEDDYDHGFAIDAFGISQRMPAKGTIVVDFVVTKAGEFPFYCSVSCGSGVVHGEDRGHFDQIGRLHVRSLISETVDYAPDVDFAAEARKSSMLKETQRYLEELGYEAVESQITFDEDNTLWLTQDRDLKTASSTQALYFDSISADGPERIWLFIDVVSGKAIETAFGK